MHKPLGRHSSALRADWTAAAYVDSHWLHIAHIAAAAACSSHLGRQCRRPAMQLDWEHAPELRACAWSEYAQRESGLYNFVKEVHVAPDGLCVLTNSEDNVLRVFEAPQQQQQQQQASSDPPRELHAVLRCPEGETVHSCAWYPFMTSANPTSCVFASTSRDQPVHMWDAYTGKVWWANAGVPLCMTFHCAAAAGIVLRLRPHGRSRACKQRVLLHGRHPLLCGL